MTNLALVIKHKWGSSVSINYFCTFLYVNSIFNAFLKRCSLHCPIQPQWLAKRQYLSKSHQLNGIYMIKPQQSILCSFLGKGHLGRNWNDNLREPCSNNKCKERPEAAGVKSMGRKNNKAEGSQGSTSSCAHLNLSGRGSEPPGNLLAPAGRTCLSLQCV